MKTLLTLALTTIALSANAGRYYYRHYHYYGPRDDSGKYAFLVIIGIMLLLGLIGLIVEAVSHLFSAAKIAKYTKGSLIITTTNGKFAPESGNFITKTIDGTDVREWGSNVWIGGHLVSNGAFWAPVFTKPEIEFQDENTTIYRFGKSHNTFNGRCFNVDQLHALHTKDRLVMTKKLLTIEQADELVVEKCGDPITTSEIITTVFIVIVGTIIALIALETSSH